MMVIDQKLYENIEKYTRSDYDGNFKEDGWLNTDEPNYMVSDDSIQSMLEDLLWEVMHWKEKYEDLTEDVDSNYKLMSIDEQVEMYDRDFIDTNI